MNDLETKEGSPLGPVEEGKVYPKYVWRTGTTFFLSKTEQIIADVFLDTRSYAACVRALAKEGIEHGHAYVKELTEREHVKEYLAEQFDERGITSGWTEQHWLKTMSDHLRAASDYEQAKEEERFYTSILAEKKNDPEAVLGLMTARKKKLEASKRRLANGDLYAMKLIGDHKGFFEKSDINLFNQPIIVTQQNGNL